LLLLPKVSFCNDVSAGKTLTLADRKSLVEDFR
jgi:hypothetical protein